MKIPLITILSFAFFMPACKKKTIQQADLLPPYTENGAHNFGCLINGVAFLPKDEFMRQGLSADFYDDTNGKHYLKIMAFNKNFGAMAIHINDHIFDNSTNDIDTVLSIGRTGDDCFASYYSNNEPIADTITSAAGRIRIRKLYFKQHFSSPTFSFDLVNIRTNDTLHITEGRFDLY